MSKTILKTTSLRIGELLKICHTYSFRFAFWSALWWLCFYIKSPLSHKLSKYALKKKTAWLDRYIESYHSNIIDHYLYTPNQTTPIKKPTIWVFWGQGEDSMPPLIKACYRQLTHFNSNARLITNKNLHNYINLPDTLHNKVIKGKLSWANYSDIIRNKLISQYGGLWLDATVWVTRKIPIDLLNEMPIYTANEVAQPPANAPFFWTSGDINWSSWALWSRDKDYILFSFVAEMLCEIATNKAILPDYVTQDYLIDYACRHSPTINLDMRSMILTNPKRLELAKHMNEPFNADIYRQITKGEFLFKLSFRANWQKQTPTKEQTLYGRVLEGVIE